MRQDKELETLKRSTIVEKDLDAGVPRDHHFMQGRPILKPRNRRAMSAARRNEKAPVAGRLSGLLTNIQALEEALVAFLVLAACII